MEVYKRYSVLILWSWNKGDISMYDGWDSYLPGVQQVYIDELKSSVLDHLMAIV